MVAGRKALSEKGIVRKEVHRARGGMVRSKMKNWIGLSRYQS